MSPLSAPHSLSRACSFLDGAVCARCGLDAAAVCQALSEAPPGEARAALLERVAPSVAAEPKLAARLLEAPHIAGNIWHADHRIAVHEGGGECTVDNMQVLCVACHMRKTRREASARAEARRLQQKGGKAKGKASPNPANGLTSAYFE